MNQRHLALLAVALCLAPAAAFGQASPTPAPNLASTPEPTEEPTTPPSDAIVAAAAVGPEWAAFAKIAENANDFISTVVSHEMTLKSDTTISVKITSRKPHYARCEIVAGDGIGGVAIWRGGEKVQAHEGGEHKDIVVVLPRHNKHVTDAFGIGCGDTTPDMMVGYSTHNGKLTEAAGPVVDGQPTDVVTWVPQAGDAVKAQKVDYFISKTSHLVVETKLYYQDKVVGDAHWTIQVDPGVKFSAFDIGTP